MRKHSARKWLHFILDLLPVIILPVFAIYEINHDHNTPIEVEAEESVFVDFNQYVENNTLNKFSKFGVSYTSSTSQVINDVYRADDYSRLFTNANYRFNVGDKLVLSAVCYSDNISSFIFGDFSQRSITNVPTLFRSNFTYYSSTQYPIGFYRGASIGSYFFLEDVNIFNLTQMFGSGNEPTLNEFNSLFPNDYYSYTLSDKQLINTGTITYNNNDIGSQMLYSLYKPVKEYFNFNNVFNFGDIYHWFELNIFHGTAPLSFFIVWNIVLYQFVMDLVFLIYGLFMWFIDMCEKLMDKPLNSIK